MYIDNFFTYMSLTWSDHAQLYMSTCYIFDRTPPSKFSLVIQLKESLYLPNLHTWRQIYPLVLEEDQAL